MQFPVEHVTPLLNRPTSKKRPEGDFHGFGARVDLYNVIADGEACGVAVLDICDEEDEVSEGQTPFPRGFLSRRVYYQYRIRILRRVTKYREGQAFACSRVVGRRTTC